METTENTEQPPMIFAFVGGVRSWNPLNGHKAPSGMIYEMRSIPGNVVACATSKEAVIQKLEEHLDRCMDHAATPEAWYIEAWRSVSKEDCDEFGETLAGAARTRQQPRKSGDAEYFVAPTKTLQTA